MKREENKGLFSFPKLGDLGVQYLMLLILMFNCIEGCLMVVSDLNKNKEAKLNKISEHCTKEILSLGLLLQY